MKAIKKMLQESFVYLNGNIILQSQARIAIDDRGFRYGDGVFETIRVEQGQPYRWVWHEERLREGLTTLKIKAEIKKLYQYSLDLIKKNKMVKGIVRIAISRGQGGRGYLPNQSDKPTILIETLLLSTDTLKVMNLWLSEYVNIATIPSNPGLKTMQGLTSVLARMEAAEHECDEALLLTQEQQVSEVSSGNLFWYKDNVLYTPDVKHGIVAGVMRRVICELSPFSVQIGDYSLSDLEEAEEVFVSNVAWLVVPVNALQPNGWKWQQTTITEKIGQLIERDIEHDVQDQNIAMG